jgi:hypothetical protein
VKEEKLCSCGQPILSYREKPMKATMKYSEERRIEEEMKKLDSG